MILHFEIFPNDVTTHCAIEFPCAADIEGDVTFGSSYQFALRPLRPMSDRKRKRMFAFELLPLESLLSSEYL